MTARCPFVFTYTLLCCALSAITASLPEGALQEGSLTPSEGASGQGSEGFPGGLRKRQGEAPIAAENDGTVVAANPANAKPSKGKNDGAWENKRQQAAEGPLLRRLAAGKVLGRRMSGLGRGFGAVLMLLGSMLASTALWRKTSELYHSPRQALRKVKMRLLGQVPASWEDFVRHLPVLDDGVFPELRPMRRRFEKKPVVVMSVPRPSKGLSAFLGLTEEQRKEGIVIKGKSTVGCTAKEAAFELFAHQRLAKDLPLSLPALGAYRDSLSNTLYLVTPRARADVALFTRRMPEKVKLKLAFAEMLYSLWGMHKRGWVHRDIKGCNYFVSQSGHALLADFEGFWRSGMHAIMYGEEVEIIFTENYIAPELTFDGEYQVFDYKTDVYALGVSFREMLDWMGDVPVPQRELANDLVSNMLQPEVAKRYDLQQCMSHPYFSELDFSQLESFKYGKAFEGNYMTPYKFL